MNAYIKLSTLEYPRHEGDIALDPAGMADYAQVEWTDRPTFDPAVQRCGEGEPEQIDGIWYMTWRVRNVTEQEIEKANIPFDPFK